MPLQQLKIIPGVNRENTRYASEGKWYESDKVRFRQGTPEQIGGWVKVSSDTFLGVCRSLFSWVTLAALRLLGVGTNLKFYINRDGIFYDITPIRTTIALGSDPFATVNASTTVTVTAASHGAIVGDFVTFSGATAVAGLDLNGEYQVTIVTGTNTFLITAASAANATTTGGGASVSAVFQINTGPAIQLPSYGWGAGYWGSSTWGNSTQMAGAELRLWSQANFGEDLIFGPRYGGLYYWDSSVGVGSRAVSIAAMGGASSVPTVQQVMLVSDASRFVMVFGCNEIGSSTLDPMLIRWSDQESYLEWYPSATNQAGSLRLSHGSEIFSALQVRQEILVWTDVSLYSLQYTGAPIVWSSTLLADNISSGHPNSPAVASGVAYWMGKDKFYMYDGRVQTLNCDLRQYVFSDFNYAQSYQVFGSTNEAFNEVWWFYCSASSETIDRYVVYNYMEKIWYYGTLGRTAWIDAGLVQYPIAATYNNQLVYQENGVVDGEGATDAAINSYITSSQFDIGDGHNLAFVWRMLPDLTFRGSSTTVTPQVTITLLPLQNSGSGYTVPPSVGGSNEGTVVRTGTYDVDQFTGQINTRIRARQMSMKIESNTLGTQWQLGYPRIDIRPDGRR